MKPGLKISDFTARALSALTVLIVLQCYFVLLAATRFIAWDEGFYVLAAKLVWSGKSPYLDFFYPQAPLFPYLLAALSPLSMNWLSLRLISATCAALTGAILWLELQKKHSRLVALICLGLYVSSHLVFGWFTTVKAYSMTALLLLLCYSLSQSKKSARIIIAGLLLGLATNVRLYVIVTTPFFLSRRDAKYNLAFMAGVFLGLLPASYWFFQDPDSFWFNNLEYHFMRSRLGFLGGLPYKRLLLEKMFLLQPSSQFFGFEFWCWTILTAYTAALTLLGRISYSKTLGLTLVLLLVSWVPTPNYLQYFSIVVPFILLASAPSVELLLKNGLGRTLVCAFCALFLLSFSKNLELYNVHGVGLTGIPNSRQAHLQSLIGIREIRDAIDEFSDPQDLVFSYWPGFLLELNSRILGGSENHFTYRVGDKIKDTARRKRLKLLSKEDVRVQIARGIPTLVVLEKRAANRFYKKALQKGGYINKKEINGVVILKRDDTRTTN
jgi:hypothetical protein